jgi:hypothetical protein
MGQGSVQSNVVISGGTFTEGSLGCAFNGKPSGFGAYFMANPTTVQAKVDTSTFLANASGKNIPQVRLRQGARDGNDDIGMAIFM